MCTFELTANKQTSKQAGRQACMHSQETHMAHILQINVIISMHSFMKTTAIHHRRHFFLFGIDKCRSENQRFPSRKPLGIFNLKTIIVLHFNRIISPSFFEWLMHLSRVRHFQSLSNFESSINTHQSEFELLFQYITRYSNL